MTVASLNLGAMAGGNPDILVERRRRQRLNIGIRHLQFQP